MNRFCLSPADLKGSNETDRAGSFAQHIPYVCGARWQGYVLQQFRTQRALLAVSCKEGRKFVHCIFQNLCAGQIYNAEMIRIFPVESASMYDQKFFLF